jgi:hypothetical protein
MGPVQLLPGSFTLVFRKQVSGFLSSMMAILLALRSPSGMWILICVKRPGPTLSLDPDLRVSVAGQWSSVAKLVV